MVELLPDIGRFFNVDPLAEGYRQSALLSVQTSLFTQKN